MAEALVQKINSAINHCLDEVCGTSDQAARISEFLSALRADPNWSEWEILEVEEAVRHTVELVAG